MKITAFGFKTFPLLLLSFCLVLASCNNNPSSNSGKPLIVCTTGMLGDATAALIGENAKVETLMGPGVDPHLYKASQGDVSLLSNARVIVYNGLHLEGKMGEIFSKLETSKTVIAAAEALEKSRLINATEYQGATDPHVWFDVSLWSQVVNNLSNQLIQEFPQHKEEIVANQKTYTQQLEELHQFCMARINEIPRNQRVLITAHDAFKYFSEAYDIEVRGLQGISTTAEYGLKDVSNLVSFIVGNSIKAIFIESSVSPKSIEAVLEGCRSRGHKVVVGGELFSDAMGEAGTPEGTYLGMVKHNVNTITEALK